MVKIFLSPPEDRPIDFREGKGGRERGMKQQWERNPDWLPLVQTYTGTKPTTQACALNGNLTCDLPLYRMMLQPTETHEPRLNAEILDGLTLLCSLYFPALFKISLISSIKTKQISTKQNIITN